MPDQRPKYDETFKAEALRLASKSRSGRAAARQLGISPRLLYRRQQAQLVPVTARSLVHDGLKAADEVALIEQAARQGDVQQGQLRVEKLGERALYPQVAHVLA